MQFLQTENKPHKNNFWHQIVYYMKRKRINIYKDVGVKLDNLILCV